MADGDTETVSVELPADVYERLAATDDRDVPAVLTDLAHDHAAMRESIATYTDHGEGPAGFADLGPETLFEVPPPVGALLGFDLVSMDAGAATIEFDAGPKHANPMGTLHGGVLCDVGDAAMGTAFASTLAPDESFTTLELDVKFRKPVWEAALTATAEVTDRGRRTGLVECTVTDADDAVVANLDSVCLVLRGEDAAGR